MLDHTCEVILYAILWVASNEILSEISKIHDLNFEYVELGIEGHNISAIIVRSCSMDST